MSKEILEKIAKHYAALSDAYEALASEAEESEDDPKPAKKGKKPVADDEDDDLPAPKKPAAKKAAAKKPAADEDDDDGDEDGESDDGPSEQEVIAAATKLIKATDRATALKIIKKFGGSKIAEVDEDKYPKLLAALKAATPKAGKKAADEDDDI